MGRTNSMVAYTGSASREQIRPHVQVAVAMMACLLFSAIRLALAQQPANASKTAAGAPVDLAAMELIVAQGIEPITPTIIDEAGNRIAAPLAFASGTPIALETERKPTGVRRDAERPFADKRLMMIYAAGGKSFGDNRELRIATSKDGGHTWGDDRMLERNPDLSVQIGRPTALVDAEGMIHVFYFGLVRYTKDPATSQSDMWTVRSADGGRTWFGRQKIWSGYTGMTEPAIQLRTGRLLVPLGYLLELGRFAAAVVRSDDRGTTWAHSDRIAIPADADAAPRARGLNGGALEPTIVELSDGRVLLLVRTLTGRFWRSISTDLGVTWGSLEPTEISCGGTGTLHKFADGRLLLIWNPADDTAIQRMGYPHGYARQHIAFSSDDGATWSRAVEFIRHRTRVVHSIAVESTAGKLLVTVPGYPLLLSAGVEFERTGGHNLTLPTSGK